MNKLTDHPEVQNIVREVSALNATLLSLEQPEGLSDAKRQVRQVWESRKEPTTTEDFVIDVAMAKVLGEPPKKVTSSYTRPALSGDLTSRIFETVGIAWVIWATGEASQAASYLRYLHPIVGELDEVEEPGAVHRLVLGDWAKALGALIQGERSEAVRYFTRAYEMGASFGTDSHPVVLWTMAASLLT